MTDLLSVTLFKDLEQLEHYPLLLHCAKEGTSAERGKEEKREGRRGGEREIPTNTICYTTGYMYQLLRSRIMKLMHVIVSTIPASFIEVEPYVLPHKESRPVSLLHSAWK